MLVVAFLEIISVAYIYGKNDLNFTYVPNRFHIGFNRFMNDVKMMLGKRAAEYYLFLTWCITAPILLVVNIDTILPFIFLFFSYLGNYHYKIFDSINHYEKCCWIWISRIYFSTMD